MTEGDACRYTPSMIKSLLAGMMVAAVCAVQAGEYGDSAVRAARELSGAVKTGDMMWMIEKMYPPMKKQLVASFPGGEASFMETMREKMQAAAAVMKERGMVVETYEIGQPAAEHLVRGGAGGASHADGHFHEASGRGAREGGEYRCSGAGEGFEG